MAVVNPPADGAACPGKKPIARGGYHDYSVLTESFTMRRPSSVEEAKILETSKAG